MPDEDNKFNLNSRIEEITHLICASVKESELDLSTTLHKEWDKWEMDYRDKKAPKIFPFRGCANFSVNITSTNIDGMTPRLVEDLFDYQEPIEAVAVDVQDPDGKLASTINRFMSWDIESNDSLREEYWHCIEGAEVRGLDFAYTYWESEKGYIKSDKQILIINGKQGLGKDGMPLEYTPEVIESLKAKGYQVEEQTVTVKEFKYKKYAPKTVCIDGRDVSWNKDAISMEDAFNNGFVSIKIWKTLDEIKRIVQGDTESIFSDYKKFEDIMTAHTESKALTQAWKPKKIEFRLVFTQLDIDGDGLEEKVIVLVHLDTQTLIGIQEFPYDHGECPIVPFRIKPLHKKISGVGIAEMLWHEKGYLDSIRNQMCDNRTLHNSPTRMFTKVSGFNPAIHRPGFGATWELTEISDGSMRIEQITPIHNDLWNEFSALKSEANQRVGMSEITKGAMPDQSMTFRGMMMLLEEGSKSRGMFKRWIAQSIQKVSYQRLRLYQQYWGREARQDKQIQSWIKEILGENNKVFEEAGKMDALDHKFNIVLKATNDDKKINVVRTRDTAEFLLQMPEVQQNPKYKRRLIIDQLRATGVKDPDSYYPTIIEMEKIEQNRVTIAQRQIAEEQAQAQAQKDQEMNEALKAKDEGEIKEIHDKTFEREVGRLNALKEFGLMDQIENAEAEQNNEMATIEKEM